MEFHVYDITYWPADVKSMTFDTTEIFRTEAEDEDHALEKFARAYPHEVRRVADVLYRGESGRCF